MNYSKMRATAYAMSFNNHYRYVGRKARFAESCIDYALEQGRVPTKAELKQHLRKRFGLNPIVMFLLSWVLDKLLERLIEYLKERL